MTEISDFNINSFLKFGFYLDSSPPKKDLFEVEIDKEKFENYSIDDLVDYGYEVFITSLKRIFDRENLSTQKHLVPISGGIDSRLILAGLIEVIGHEKISTYTYGTPGTWNYEIGSKISNLAGTMHKSFEISSSDYTLESLTDAAARLEHSVPSFFHPNFSSIERYFENYTVWSGFLGCLWKGKSLPYNLSQSKEEAVKHFINFNKVISCNISKFPDEYFYDFLSSSIDTDSQLSFDDQLSFYQRQMKYTFKYISFRGQKKVICPLMEKDNLAFWLSINHSKYRMNGILLSKIMKKYFPDFYSLPDTENYGASASSNILYKSYKKYSSKFKNRMHRFFPSVTPNFTNYTNFNLLFIRLPEFRNTIKSLLVSLKKRKIIRWIDIEALYENFVKGRKKNINELILLSSLELHLRSKNHG